MAELVGSFVEPKPSRSDAPFEAQRMVWLDRLELELKRKSPGEFVGRVLRWQRCDGYAEYVVVEQRPVLKIAHLDAGDGYAVEPALIRGLNVEDVSAMCKAEDALARMFAKNGVR